ncbi:MAG: MlaD family protein [Chlorobi bacterium]|nr:MlaD family protein [Chlorobiota bacterium]MCI0715982.1 MlaD family protein [Chlorobiota bacterium]
MEPNKNKKIAVALFIISGFLLFTIAIFVIGSKENLFTPTFQLKSEFETVSGLKNGSAVRFNGISVGKVDAIDIQGTDKVLVTMTLEKSVQKYIKKDSKATVSSEGLVGNKVIEITSGSVQAPGVEDNELIGSIKPVDVQEIIASLKESSENASNITKDLSEITERINRGEGTIGQLVNNESLYRGVDSTFRSLAGYSGELSVVFGKITNTVDNVSVDLDQLTKQVRNITGDIAEVTRKMNSSESIVGTLLTDTIFANNLKAVIRNANMTTKNLESGSFSFAQNMEALKHNFLFKGYFEDIGYWDKPGWEKNLDKRALELRLKEQELINKEKELKDLEEKLKLEQKLNDEK